MGKMKHNLSVGRQMTDLPSSPVVGLAPRRNTSLAPRGTTTTDEQTLGSQHTSKLSPQIRNQVLMRQNLYNWKFSISEIMELLIVVMFSSNLRRLPILQELVTVRNPDFFATVVEP